MPTNEELEAAFLGSIDDAKTLISKTFAEGNATAFSPTVMTIMRKVPDLPENGPIQFKPFLSNPEGKVPAIGVFCPGTLTPPGWPMMPKDVFWSIMKMINQATSAYGNIVAMEAWLARPKNKEEALKVPDSLEDYEHREEALVVTTEREGEYRIYQAIITRDGDKATLAPWEEHITHAGPTGVSRYERLRLDDPINDDPPPKLRVEGDVFRSVPANVKS